MSLNKELDGKEKAISYEEQMRNLQLLDSNQKEMTQLKAELFTVRKDYEKLESEQVNQQMSYQKLKTIANIKQQKAGNAGHVLSVVKDKVLKALNDG